MSALALQALTKSFGEKPALDRVSLDVAQAERCVVLGASGAGKTTLLRLVAGLERADSGSIAMSGLEVSGYRPQRRPATLVFSGGGLFPHLSAFENLAFAMRVRRVRTANVRKQVVNVARLLKIESHLEKNVSLLSGGERQRVALGRALLRDPALLLLDEPFAHLDPSLRGSLRDAMLESLRANKCSVLYVTHDHEDAFAIGDRIAILIGGRLVQCGRPQEVYDFPATLEVARFVGHVPMNLFDYGVEIVGIRPEHIELDDTASDLNGVVRECSFGGPAWLVGVQTPRGDARVRVSDLRKPLVGERVGLRFPPQRVRRFDARTGVALQ